MNTEQLKTAEQIVQKYVGQSPDVHGRGLSDTWKGIREMMSKDITDFASQESKRAVDEFKEKLKEAEKEPYVLEVVGNFLHSSGLVFNTDDADHVASDLIRYLKVEGISIAKAAPSESQEEKPK